MKVALGSDHVGYGLKKVVMEELEELGIEYQDYGTYGLESTDYPVWGEKAARAVASGECDKGIVICGSGAGISMAAGKVKGIRIALCSDCYTAALSTAHNDSNMIAMGSQVVGPGLAKMIVRAWLTGSFEGGRHRHRIDMISEIENE